MNNRFKTKKEDEYGDVFVSDYDKTYLNEDDLERVSKYKSDAKSGLISTEDGHKLSEEIRKSYGYSGGTDGSQYIKLDDTDDTQPKASKYSTPKYTGSRWDTPLRKTAEEALSMSYGDFLKSDVYAALADKYTKAGKNAMLDTLGAASSRTGGLASSYAAAAAGESYNGYMEKLADAAREMYDAEKASKQSDVSMLRGLADNDYGRYLDDVSILQNDRSFNYSAARDALSDARYDDETEYSRGIYADETAYNREQARRDEARSLVAQYVIGGMAGYIPQNVLEASGYTTADVAALEKSIANDTTTQGSGAAPESSPSLTYPQAKELYEEGVRTQAVIDVLNSRVGENWFSINDEVEDEEKFDDIGKSYLWRDEDVYDFLEERGVHWEDQVKALDPQQFASRMQNDKVTTDIDGNTYTFRSYTDYIDRFAEIYGLY